MTFIIVDPMGVSRQSMFIFRKLQLEILEVDYYGNFEGRSKAGPIWKWDHIPSKEAVRIYLKGTYSKPER